MDYLLWVLVPLVGIFSFFVLKKRRQPVLPGDETTEKLQTETEETAVEKSEEFPEPLVEQSGLTVKEPPAKELKDVLQNTRTHLFGRIKSLFAGKSKINKDELEEIEEVLYTSDLGPKTVQHLMSKVENQVKASGETEKMIDSLKDVLLSIFSSAQSENTSPQEFFSQLQQSSGSPVVLMIVGVNGAGKTTTIGKLAGLLAEENKKVLLAAGDTFRAAAGEQLKVWTDRANVEIFFPEGVKDPAAVAFDAVQKAKKQEFDFVIVDTAGRLHTQKNLMEELKKVKRVMSKVIPDAPHETLLVLDANSGQNALIQAQQFHEALGVTGVVLTKLDGTAKGGVAVGIAHELALPIKLIGVGEGLRDLRGFSSREFVDSIF